MQTHPEFVDGTCSNALPRKTHRIRDKAVVRAVLVIFLLTASVANASAYTGPIPAVGEVVSVIGVLAGLFTLVVGAVWYPAKKMIKSICSFLGKE